MPTKGHTNLLTKNKPKMLYLLNTVIVPNDGLYRRTTITKSDAKWRVESEQFISAVGHQAAADIMTADFGITVPCNRTEIVFANGDKAICLFLNRRQAEGAVLTATQSASVGYEYVLVERIA